MKTTNSKVLDLGTKHDTLACVALLVTAITILVSGAVSVHHQNTLQMQQAQQAVVNA